MRVPSRWVACRERVVNLSGFFSALVYGAIAWQSQRPEGLGLVAFGGAVVLAWLLLLGVVWLLFDASACASDRQAPEEPLRNPTQQRSIAGLGNARCWGIGCWIASVMRRARAAVGRDSHFYIVFWALVFRVLGAAGAPLFEDDYFRYLWDGYRFATDGTPYGEPPERWFDDPTVPALWQPVLSGINHPDLPTVYGPVFQYAFLGAFWLDPAQLWPLKLILVAADCGVIALLGAARAPLYGIALYAWNPLVLKEIAFTAHPDGLVGLCLLAAVLCLVRRRRGLAAGAMALAIGAKVSALPVAPFLLARTGWRGMGMSLAAMTVLYVPFLGRGADQGAGLQAFAQTFEFNSALFAVFAWLAGPDMARYGSSALYLAGLAACWLWQRSRSATEPLRVDVLLGGLLVISPVINPWYLLWVLPCACLTPSLTAWVASGALLLSYATGLHLDRPELGPYGHPAWVRPVEFTAVALAFVWDCRFRGRGV